MTGWRIGYTIGDSKVIKAMGKLQGQSTSCPNSIAQYAAIEALIGDQSQVLEMANIFKKRRDLIVNSLNSIQHITCDMPMGAFYVFPNIKFFIGKEYKENKINSASDLSLLLLKEKFVVTVSGDAFGAPENIRFSYAVSEQTINKTIERIESLFSLIK
jgi:aspartate aminotransferase